MEEEGSGSKRSSTLPVPSPKPRPNPRPQTQVKTLASNANRNKALSSVKPSLPPKPQQSSPSSPTFVGRPPAKPARLHESKNNNNKVTQSVSNARSRNRTLQHLSEEDDNSFVNGNKNGITESQRCKEGRLSMSKYDEDMYDSVEAIIGSPPNKGQLARAKNEPTKVTSDLRNKPLPPRKPLPGLPGQTEAQESDSNKPSPVSKPPRLQKQPEACMSSTTRKLSGPLLTGFSQQSREEGKSVTRKISAPTLALSSPGLSPRGSPLSSPKISPRTSPHTSPQTLSPNFESNIADSTGLYQIVDTAERVTTMPTTRPKESVDRKFSHPTSGKTRLATRSRRLPPPTVPAPTVPAPGPTPAIPVPTIPAQRLELSSPDGSRRPAPPPPMTKEKPEVQRMPVRPLPSLPEAPRPKSVYEDSKLKPNTETMAEDKSTYSYAYREAAVSPAVQRRISAGQQPVSLATQASEGYITPDASVVTDFVESMKNKPRIVSSGEYEIRAVESSDLYTTVDPVAVGEFIDGLKGREEATESSGETGTTSSMSVVEDEQRNQSSEEVSSESSDEVHEYLVPHDDDEYVEGDSDSDSFSDASSHDYLDPPPSPPLPVPRDRGSVLHDDNVFTQVKTWEESNKGAGDDDDDDDDDDDEPIEEPLYQVYTAATLARERNISRKSVSSDNSESTVEEYTKGTMQNMRMLWCQLPEVVTSGILERISDDERKRQEAMFEVITSEASYIKSLGILINHFMEQPELNHDSPNSVLEKSQHRILFSNVKTIKDMSERFLQELRTRQKEQVLISTISDIIYKYVCKHFDVYVKYCTNQVYQERAVKSLREKNPRFVEVCYKLERKSAVQGLNLQSFLVLPMQRITRFPLLVDAICHRCQVGSEEFRRTDAALSEVNKVVRDCNEGARKMERMEEMCLIQGLIEFKVKPIALVTSSRYLLRRGDLMHVQGGENRGPLKKSKLKIKAALKPTYLFLFSDLVLIAKKKSEKNFKVLDYATRSMTQVEDTGYRTVQCPHMFSLIFLENSEGKTKDYLLSASNQTDKTRWIVAFKPPAAKEGELAVYDSWDCPQVQAIHNYNSQQPDELTLHEGDVINVLRKLTDGWYHGERLCDGAQGWLPANHTEEILNEHVRRRNLLQRYRLLAASQHLMGTFMTS